MRDLDRSQLDDYGAFQAGAGVPRESPRSQSSGMSIIVSTPAKNLMMRASPAHDARWISGSVEGASSSGHKPSSSTEGAGGVGGAAVGGGAVAKSPIGTPKGGKPNKSTAAGGGADGADTEGAKLLAEIESLRSNLTEAFPEKFHSAQYDISVAEVSNEDEHRLGLL